LEENKNGPGREEGSHEQLQRIHGCGVFLTSIQMWPKDTRRNGKGAEMSTCYLLVRVLKCHVNEF
jgi:hypothetical protein